MDFAIAVVLLCIRVSKPDLIYQAIALAKGDKFHYLLINRSSRQQDVPQPPLTVSRNLTVYNLDR
ncbi:MAG: hypothetical protein AB4040_03035 [Synechococcus sp.]